MATKKFRVWTGPTTVKQVAQQLSAAGLKDAVDGTEHVYFALGHSWDDRPYEAARDVAQEVVNEVYPHAGFRVEKA